MNGFAPMKTFASQKMKTAEENAQDTGISVQGLNYKTYDCVAYTLCRKLERLSRGDITGYT